MDSGLNAAEKAFRGTEQYIDLGEWTHINEDMIVVFRCKHLNSTCYVTDSKGSPREGAAARGTKTEEILVSKGEKVYAMEAHIRFKSAVE